jgi:membrane protease YdiL (CAAX protease family)
MLALTPAICEEILFRGYIQRQAERSLGAWGGILFSGIIFGFYHLRLTQAIPLSLLGIYMAWLTWQTRSLWPAILVHFINNTFAAVLGKIAAGNEALAEMDSFTFPAWVILLSVLVLTGAVLAMIRRPIGPARTPAPEILPASEPRIAPPVEMVQRNPSSEA